MTPDFSGPTFGRTYDDSIRQERVGRCIRRDRDPSPGVEGEEWGDGRWGVERVRDLRDSIVSGRDPLRTGSGPKPDVDCVTHVVAIEK